MDAPQATAGSQRPRATFKGRLELDRFTYSAPDAPLPRRSPRRRAAAASAAPTPEASAQPRPSGAEPGAEPAAKKRRRPRAAYAPQATYAHLPLLPDALAPRLLVLFVGLNPGIRTAVSGHAYAHPSNLFWKLLFASGVTPRPCRADEDRQMPTLYALGLTNIVARPSRSGAELSRREMDDGVALLDAKARRWRPETLCVVGKSIWESIWRVRHGRPVGADFRYGWQDDAENMGAVGGEWPGARVFVATSTSGLAASLSPAEKQAIWAELGAWVKMRRAEREAEDKRAAGNEREARDSLSSSDKSQADVTRNEGAPPSS